MSNTQGENTLNKLFSTHPITDIWDPWCAGPIIIGHRGTNLWYPENTVPAFVRAIALGAHMIELDVRMTRDGHVVVIHDATVDRTMSGSGRVSDFTLAQLKAMTMKMPAGSKANAQPVHIATLEEVFQALPRANIAVEIKDESWPLCLKVVELIKRYQREDRTMLVLISLKRGTAKRLRRLAPQVATGHTTTEIVRFIAMSKFRVSRVFKTKGAAFEVPPARKRFKIVTKAFVKAAHKKGIRVFVWTINDQATIEKLCKLGVDGIFTDDPALASAVVQGLRASEK